MTTTKTMKTAGTRSEGIPTDYMSGGIRILLRGFPEEKRINADYEEVATDLRRQGFQVTPELIEQTATYAPKKLRSFLLWIVLGLKLQQSEIEKTCPLTEEQVQSGVRAFRRQVKSSIPDARKRFGLGEEIAVRLNKARLREAFLRGAEPAVIAEIAVLK